MDANGTRYHLLLGRSDWASCRQGSDTLEDLWKEEAEARPLVDWDAGRAELTLWPRLFRFPPPSSGSTGGSENAEAPAVLVPEQRRGAGRDQYGNTYWVDDTCKAIHVQSSGSAKRSVFWALEPAGPAPAAAPGEFGPVGASPAKTDQYLGGLAVTTHHYLVVGTHAPAGLLVFDLHAGGPPLGLQWPPGVPFAPFDLAPTPEGGVLVLDRAHRRYWRLDAGMNVVRRGARARREQARGLFQPVGGQPGAEGGRPVAPALSTRDATRLKGADPIALEALPGGRVLVLERVQKGASQVRLYRDGVPPREATPLGVEEILEEGSTFTLEAHDFAYVPAEGPGEPGRLTVVSTEGNQAFVFLLHESAGRVSLTPQPEYLPLRLFHGRALVGAQGRLFYDLEEGFIPLVAQWLPRYEKKAVLVTEPDRFDGRLPGCVWHRLFLDACIPPGTSIQVRSRAADTKEELKDLPFRQEPEPYLRSNGSELPFAPRPSGEHRGTWELLFQHPRGRYLQLELTLFGTGGATPRLRALRAYYPRTSYAERFLPAIYREEAESASFLERFLANLEGILTPIEDRIAAAQMLFDARSAPAEVLEWLAGWLGLAFEPAWEKEEHRRRLLIRHAYTFFQWRGTPRGLRMALRLALDERPDASLFEEQEDPLRSPIRIDEHFRTGRDEDRPPEAIAHRFTVYIPVPREATAEQLDELKARARRVVELEKPAHTLFDVRFYWAMFRVGKRARLGVDTVASLGSRAPEARRAMVLGRAHLAESFLRPRPGHSAPGQREVGWEPLTHRSTTGGELR